MTSQRRILGILWYELVTNMEVATLSQLPSINEATSRRHSLWPCQAYGPGCSCPPSPTPLSYKLQHDMVQDSLASGEDNQAINKNTA